MAEVGFEAFAWKMTQRNERLSFPATVLEEIALHLGVAAVVAMFVAKATKRLRGRVPLFGRRGLVLGEESGRGSPGRDQVSVRNDSESLGWARDAREPS